MKDETIETEETVEETTEAPAQELEENTDEPKLEGSENTESDLGLDESKQEGEAEEESTEEETVDYKAKLEEEKLKTKKAEDKIVKMKREAKESPEEDEEEEPAPTVDPVEIQQAVATAVEAELTKFKADQTSDSESTIINSVSSNDDEAELIKYHLDNKIKRSGFTREDIIADVMLCKDIANRKQTASDLKELKATLTANNSVAPSSKGSNQQKKSGGSYKPTASDQRTANQFYGGDVKKYLKFKNMDVDAN